MQKCILVTGSSGFIAFHTIKLLLQQGYQVVGIDDQNDSTSILLKQKRNEFLENIEGFHFYYGSITDQALLENIFSKYQFSGIINLAARAGVRRSVLYPYEYIETNEKGFLNILTFAKNYGITNIIQASTSSVYEGENMPFTENSACNRAVSPYAVTKKASEGYAYVFHYLHNLNITILRFFTVYGPYGRPDMSIFRFIKWIYEGSPLKVSGDGRQTRDFTFVEDIAQAILLALEKPSQYEIFNIGNDRTFSLLDMIAILENLLQKEATIQFIDKDPSDIAHTHANLEKIQKNFDWRPSTPFEIGLEKTVVWFLENYDTWVKDIEI